MASLNSTALASVNMTYTSNVTLSIASTPASNPISIASDYEDVTPVQRLSALGAALFGVLGTTTAFVTIKWISTRAHPLISVNYFSVCCAIISAASIAILPNIDFVFPTKAKEWGYLVFLGICGFIMQLLRAAGLAYEKSSRATNMTYSQMVFALFFDKLVFDHTPGLMSMTGSGLILGGAIFVAMQKSRVEQDKSTGDSNMNMRDVESQQGLIENAAVNDDEHLSGQDIPMQRLR